MVIVPLVAGFLLLITLGSIWSGYVLSVLWGWFLVPLGVPAINVAHAIGISILVGLFTARAAKSQDDDWVKIWTVALLAPVLALGLGWIVKGFM